MNTKDIGTMAHISMNDTTYSSKAELLFPAHLIPILRDLRGPQWRDLVDRVAALPDTHPDSLAFVYMMIKLGECLRCHSNNYKFLRGCALCSIQTIQSFKGEDEELLDLFQEARQELNQRLGHYERPLAA